MHSIGNEPLVSGLVFQEALTPTEILSALTQGKRIKLISAEKDYNFYLEDNEIKSEKITYTKGLPQMWFNKDIKFEIVED